MEKSYLIISQTNTVNGGVSGVSVQVQFTASTGYTEIDGYFIADDQDVNTVLTDALDAFDQYCIDNGLYGDTP